MKLVANATGRLLALVDDTRIVVVELPQRRVALELSIRAGADVAFVRDRLLVLAHATRILHVIDPRRATSLGEIQLRSPAHLSSLTPDLALVTSANATYTLDADSVRLAPLAVRGQIAAAGSLGSDAFVLATTGLLETWSSASRSPVLRMRVDAMRKAPDFIGGNAQRIWCAMKGSTAIDVVSLASRTSRQIPVPQPIASVIPAPDGNLAVITERGTAYAIDLASAHPVRELPVPAVLDLVWLGGDSLAYVLLDGSLRYHACDVPEPQHDAPAPDPVVADDTYARLQAWRARVRAAA